MDYRFNVWTPTGTPAGTRLRDFSFVLSAGLRMQLTPEGDCKEASFRAKGAGIQIPPLSAVQIEYLNGFDWTPIFYGQVRVGGNQRDVNGENYTLRSLALRFYGVTLSPGFTTPQQPAHLTVIAIAQDLISSGQLASGNSPPMFFSLMAVPDLGFDCRAIVTANQQNAGALLDQIVQDGKGLGVDVRWGVGPDQIFFCRAAKTDTLALTNLSRVVWKEPVAETPCTIVRWFLSQKADGQWLTYESESPLKDTYGSWTFDRSVGAGINPWTLLNATYTALAQSGGTLTPVSPQPTINAARLQDGLTGGGTGQIITIPGEITQLRAALPSAPKRITISGEAVKFLPGGGGTNLSLVSLSPAGAVAGSVPLVQGTGWGLTPITETAVFDNGDGWKDFAIYPGIVPVGTTSVQFSLSELAFYAVNTELLDRLAEYHYSTPASDPADLSLPLFIPPANLAGRVTAGTYDRAVDAWEYRISTERGLEVAALTGQADDPGKKAQADLIKANDGKATVTAITAQR